MSHSSSDLRPLFLKIRTGNCKNNDHRGYQLQHKCRHIEPKCDGIHKAEDKGTKHHSHRSHKNSSMSEKGTSDQQGCQCDGDHTLTDVDIYGFLRLRQKTSGKCGKCICHAKADHRCKDRIDGGRFYHIRIISGCPNRKAKSCFQKEYQKYNHEDHCDGCNEDIFPAF